MLDATSYPRRKSVCFNLANQNAKGNIRDQYCHLQDNGAPFLTLVSLGSGLVAGTGGATGPVVLGKVSKGPGGGMT